MGAVLVILAVLFVGARVAIPRFSSDTVARGPVTRDGARTLADCPGTPNCAGSEAADPARRVARLAVPGGMASVAGWLDAQPDARIVARDGDYLHATFHSKLMGYTDDVEFLAVPGGDEVAVRSASRIGRSDLGANRKRVERMRAGLSGPGA